MKATFKTRNQFEAEGFTSDYPNFYKGTKKSPDALVRRHLIENLGGKTVMVINVDDHNKGLLEVMYGGRLYEVYTWMLVETVDFAQISNPLQLMLNGRSAKFYGMMFRFSCSHQELNVKQAVRLARWVLKMAKVEV